MCMSILNVYHQCPQHPRRINEKQSGDRVCEKPLRRPYWHDHVEEMSKSYDAPNSPTPCRMRIVSSGMALRGRPFVWVRYLFCATFIGATRRRRVGSRLLCRSCIIRVGTSCWSVLTVPVAHQYALTPLPITERRGCGWPRPLPKFATTGNRACRSSELARTASATRACSALSQWAIIRNQAKISGNDNINECITNLYIAGPCLWLLV